MIRPFKIKNLLLNGNLFLAPMADITNYPLRKILLKNGCDLVISEMVSAKAIYYGNKKTMELIKVRDDKPICIQIFGSDPQSMAYAAKMVENEGADMVEINAGCPVKKVVKTGSGCALMKDLNLLNSIVSSVVKSVKIPVSVKFRTGFNEKLKNGIEVAKVVENAGADMIHIHLRTVEQVHSGEVDLEMGKVIKKSVKIPVILNGGVTDPYKAKEMFEKTGCDGISIGRGAIFNPFIFAEIKNFFEGKISVDLNLKRKIKTFIEYLEISRNEFGDKNAMIKARKLAGMWLSRFKNASEIRNRFMKSESIDEAKMLLLKVTEL